MGNKTSTVEVKDANVDTPFGKCGLGSCKSSCCEDEQQEPEELKQIRVAIRVELAMIEKLMLDKMIAAFKQDGTMPTIQVETDSASNPTPLKRTLTLKMLDQAPTN